MSRASEYVDNMNHEDLLKTLTIFSENKDVAHLMIYGLAGIDNEEKAAIKRLLKKKVGFNAKSSLEAADFCQCVHKRAIREKG